VARTAMNFRASLLAGSQLLLQVKVTVLHHLAHSQLGVVLSAVSMKTMQVIRPCCNRSTLLNSILILSSSKLEVP